LSLTLYLYVLFSSFLPPSPPISTLFPYTTLFRSHHQDCSASARARAAGAVRPLPRTASEAAAFAWRLPADTTSASAAAPWSLFLDRKSTRLNSSHVSISYAVFCLKKKKTTTKNTI